jgi:serine protease
MRKKIFSLLLTFSFLNVVYTQTVYDNYLDGKVYIKVNKASVKGILKEDPKNIPLAKLSFVEKLVSKYGITKLYKPFYQADDDENLSSILKIEFTQINKVEAFITELSGLQNVEYAEKVRLNKTTLTPNDALFATTNGSTHLNQINAQNAWNVFSGNSNITVAIVDNAVMSTHADLVGNTYTNAIEATGLTGVDDDGNGYIDDINGYDVAGMDGVTDPTVLTQNHGTHCAGIAGATSNNSIGVASIGWGIKIIPVKCSDDNQSGFIVDYGYEGILYAVKAKAKIISCSWGNSGAFSSTEQFLIDYAWNRGCMIIACAGNNGNSTPFYPGAYNHVYCVAAVDPTDVAWSGSNYGTWVDICAPGTNILSTIPYTGTPAYLQLTGTSMATPMVAGLAGLMLSKSPNMTRNDVLNCLSATAANIYTISGNSTYVSGNLLGAGRIDAFAAMNCAATFSAMPPVANFYAFLPSTCPGVAIPFIDSSLYAPTSWSWTFQGGFPATSTSSNPSVQWATAGNYSVSLTVTNANGSNTKTKLLYVTVNNPQALPFSEGFQSTTFLPPNWVANNIWNDNIYWQRTTTAGGFGTSTACAMFDNYNMNAPGEKDEMRTPKFDFTNVVSARLRFDVAYARYDPTFSDSLEVKVSTNCGTTWTSIYLKGGTSLATVSDQSSQFVPSSTQWRRDTIDISLPTAGQGNVMFSFINRGHYGQPIYLDNINLFFPTPVINSLHPATICIAPTYTFSNISQSAASFTWNFQGGTPATSYANNPAITFANPGTYTYSIFGVNGTASASVTKTITVVTHPTLSATSGNYCEGNTYTITANGASTYTWSDAGGVISNSANVVFTPLANSLFTVVGTNAACSSQAVYTINVVPSPTFNISNETICSGGTATLAAIGATSYTWNTSATTSSIVVSPATTTIYTVTSLGSACNLTKTVSVIVSALPLSAITATNPSCANTCNGSFNANSNGGSGPYSYTLSNSPCSTLPCSNLCAGSYTLNTQNIEGCNSSTVFTLVDPTALQSTVSATDANCASCATGSLSASISGGIPPYTYTWMPSGGNSANAVNLLPGCYTVTVEDANACQLEASSCIAISTGITKTLHNSSLQIYPNPAKNSVSIDWKGFTFDCTIYNALGQQLLTKNDISNSYFVDLADYAKGIYLIEVQSGSEKIIKKLVIE